MVDCNELEGRSKSEQGKLFAKKLRKEPIRSFSDIKKGDHIARRVGASNYYYHHMLCIGHDEDGEPKMMHYSGTAPNALFALSATCSKNFQVVAKVQRIRLKEDMEDEAALKKKDAHRIVWPPDFRRYSVEDTIRRALSREGESEYDLGKNNCEHFVMWCMCGLNTSLQVGTIELIALEVVVGSKNVALQKTRSIASQAAAAGAKAVLNKALFDVNAGTKSWSIPSEALFYFPTHSNFVPGLTGMVRLLPTAGLTKGWLRSSQALFPSQFNWFQKLNAHFQITRPALYRDVGDKLGSRLSAGFGVLTEGVAVGYEIYKGINENKENRGKKENKKNKGKEENKENEPSEENEENEETDETDETGETDETEENEGNEENKTIFRVTSEALTGCAGRVGGGLAGQALIPIPFVGYMVGAVAGDLAGRFGFSSLFG